MFNLRTCVVLLAVPLVIQGSIHPNFKRLSTTTEFAFNIYFFVNGRNNTTEECSVALNQYADSLLLEEQWALEMFDSASKMPAGILSKGLKDAANFEECLDVKNTAGEVDSIYGKYCFGKLGILNGTSQDTGAGVLGQIAICMPHACSISDIRQFYSSLGFSYDISEINCQTKHSKHELDELGISAIVFLGTVTFLMTISTIYEVYNDYHEKKPLHKFLTLFSVFANGKKLLQTTTSKNQITCLHGIRAITIILLIFVHRKNELIGMTGNRKWSSETYDNFFGIILKMSSPLMDIFLLMSGLLVSYNFMNSSAKGEKFDIVRHWTHRYMRIGVPVAAILLISVSLAKNLGSGPQWLTLMKEKLENPCRQYWWTSLLFVQNYVNPNEMCIEPTWYISVDTQLYFLSPIFLILFSKCPNLKPLILGTLIVGLPMIAFYIAWSEDHHIFDTYRNIPGKWNSYFAQIYSPTHTRAASWLVGFSTGYIIHSAKQSKVDVNAKKIGIIASLCLFILIAPIVVVQQIGFNKFLDSVFLSYGGVASSIAFSCFVIASVQGYTVVLNRLLAHPLMQILSKLSYSMYLLHQIVIFSDIYRLRHPPMLDNYELVCGLWGDYMLCLVLSIFWVLAFECPTQELQSMWRRSK